MQTGMDYKPGVGQQQDEHAGGKKLRGNEGGVNLVGNPRTRERERLEMYLANGGGKIADQQAPRRRRIKERGRTTVGHHKSFLTIRRGGSKRIADP